MQLHYSWRNWSTSHKIISPDGVDTETTLMAIFFFSSYYSDSVWMVIAHHRNHLSDSWLFPPHKAKFSHRLSAGHQDKISQLKTFFFAFNLWLTINTRFQLAQSTIAQWILLNICWCQIYMQKYFFNVVLKNEKLLRLTFRHRHESQLKFHLVTSP